LIMRVLAALFYLPSSYLLCLGNAAFALLRPDALSPFSGPTPRNLLIIPDDEGVRMSG
jgi:hypothetical protein